MILHRPCPRGNAAADDDRIAHDDPRLILFRDFLRAISAGDAKAGIIAAKSLREHNLSVVILPARGQGVTR